MAAIPNTPTHTTGTVHTHTLSFVGTKTMQGGRKIVRANILQIIHKGRTNPIVHIPMYVYCYYVIVCTIQEEI